MVVDSLGKGQMSMIGVIAEAYHKTIPATVLEQVSKRRAKPLWQATRDFYGRYGIREIAEQLESLAQEPDDV